MIGIDWGTTSFRAFRLDDQGAIVDRRAAPRGILAIESARFEEELLRQVGDWIADGERRVLMAGMIGSRQGWHEAPYVRCPAGAGGHSPPALSRCRSRAPRVRILPGLTAPTPPGCPTCCAARRRRSWARSPPSRTAALACLPGTHSKWARSRAAASPASRPT